MQRVFTQGLLNSFFLTLHTMYCFSYHRVSSLMNALAGEYLCLSEVCINVNKLFTLAVLSLPVYFFIPLFCTDVVAIFLFTRWLCKQVQCFVFGVFVYHFNNAIFVFLLMVSLYKPVIRLSKCKIFFSNLLNIGKLAVTLIHRTDATNASYNSQMANGCSE